MLHLTDVFPDVTSPKGTDVSSFLCWSYQLFSPTYSPGLSCFWVTVSLPQSPLFYGCAWGHWAQPSAAQGIPGCRVSLHGVSGTLLRPWFLCLAQNLSHWDDFPTLPLQSAIPFSFLFLCKEFSCSGPRDQVTWNPTKALGPFLCGLKVYILSNWWNLNKVLCFVLPDTSSSCLLCAPRMLVHPGSAVWFLRPLNVEL